MFQPDWAALTRVAAHKKCSAPRDEAQSSSKICLERRLLALFPAEAERSVSLEGELVLGWRPALDQIVPNTKWVLEKKLGEGGFGEVWVARHESLKERRVFKFCFQIDRVRSLKREVTLFRILKDRVGEHPNIVGIQDVYFDQPAFLHHHGLRGRPRSAIMVSSAGRHWKSFLGSPP